LIEETVKYFFYKNILEMPSVFVSPASHPSRVLKHNVRCHKRDPVKA